MSEGKDIAKLALATGVSLGLGYAFYDQHSPIGKYRQEQSKRPAPEFSPGKFAATAVCNLGIAYIVAKALHKKPLEVHTDGLKLAGRLTLAGTLLTLPNHIWEGNNLVSYGMDRVFNFLQIVAMIGVIEHVHL